MWFCDVVEMMNVREWVPMCMTCTWWLSLRLFFILFEWQGGKVTNRNCRTAVSSIWYSACRRSGWLMLLLYCWTFQQLFTVLIMTCCCSLCKPVNLWHHRYRLELVPEVLTWLYSTSSRVNEIIFYPSCMQCSSRFCPWANLIHTVYCWPGCYHSERGSVVAPPCWWYSHGSSSPSSHTDLQCFSHNSSTYLCSVANWMRSNRL